MVAFSFGVENTHPRKGCACSSLHYVVFLSFLLIFIQWRLNVPSRGKFDQQTFFFLCKPLMCLLCAWWKRYFFHHFQMFFVIFDNRKLMCKGLLVEIHNTSLHVGLGHMQFLLKLALAHITPNKRWLLPFLFWIQADTLKWINFFNTFLFYVQNKKTQLDVCIQKSE